MRWTSVLMLLAGCGDSFSGTSPPDAAADASFADVGLPPPTPMFAQTAYVKSTQPLHDAHFGKSVLSGSGETLVATQYGTVSVYARDPTWRVVGELVPSTPTFELGGSVAMSSDGSTIAITATEARGNSLVGCVYVFRKSGDAWVQDGRIDDVHDINASLALSGDGNTLIAEAGNQTTFGRIFTFERGVTGWSKVASLEGGTDGYRIEVPVVLSQDGSVFAATILADGATDFSVGIFMRAGDTWVRHATLASPDQQPRLGFGLSISCSPRFETIVIGTPEWPALPGGAAIEGAGAAYVFEGDGTTWLPTAKLRAANANIGDRFGTAVAISGDASTIVVGAPSESSASMGLGGNGWNNDAPYAGAAYVFRRHGGAWWQVLYLKASNADRHDIFGSVIGGLSDDGTKLVVSALYENGGSSGIGGDQTDESQPYAGAIYAFEGTY
jgi:trimeric autotransporter adhesin